MAHPRSKFSKTRTKKRRTHIKASIPTLATCSNCGSPHLFHRVCPECGFYRGNVVIKKEATA